MKNTLSTIEAAKLMGVARCSVNNWIQSKKLKTYTTPGGHYRIMKKELKRFIEACNYPPIQEWEQDLQKILIVDDEKIVLKILTAMLEKNIPDILIKTADNGFDAGDLVHTFNPDLIILDIGMKELDGFEVCKRIKSRSSTQNIKIIIITGLMGEDLKDKAFMCGADGFLNKPVGIAKIMTEIKKLFQLNIKSM